MNIKFNVIIFHNVFFFKLHFKLPVCSFFENITITNNDYHVQ